MSTMTIEQPVRGQGHAEYLSACGFERLGSSEWSRGGVYLRETRAGWSASGHGHNGAAMATPYEARCALARTIEINA
jgi:hypothetical protein